jgi:hypothetical protein
LNGNSLVNGGQTTFTFNLIGNPTITYVGLPSTFDVVNSTTNTQTAASIHQAALGNFEDGIDYTLPSASNPLFGCSSSPSAVMVSPSPALPNCQPMAMLRLSSPSTSSAEPLVRPDWSIAVLVSQHRSESLRFRFRPQSLCSRQGWWASA